MAINTGINNIEIANRTIKITSSGKYEVAGRTVRLPKLDFAETKVFSPDDGEKLLNEIHSKNDGKICRIIVTTEDSFEAASRYNEPLVMNFANAFVPGGGFRIGARAQEETLCRCSTLYASLNSETAAQMYNYNAAYRSEGESDYMLISPNVVVFRNEKCELLEAPFKVGVVTVPAPNRFGEAMFLTETKVAENMTRRIRIMLRSAYKNGYRSLVLGAWGCGAFGNDPKNVSSYFKRVIVDEGCGAWFDEICFAIYGSPETRNVKAFRETFSEYDISGKESDSDGSVSAQQALARLKKGNERYLGARLGAGDISLRRRLDVFKNGQHPYAVIVSCSDSRVIPESIFSAGIGELFTIRVAGNVIDDHQLGSVEYAAEHLGCRLIVVLGHDGCGAVDAAMNHDPEGYIKFITDEIKTAVGDEKDEYKACWLNVGHSVKMIESSLEIHKEEEKHGLKVIGALYRLEDGRVEFSPSGNA